MTKLLQFANNAVAETADLLETDGTTLILSLGQGALFPQPGVSSEFYGTLALGPLNEIVLVTARDGDTLTIVRAQEGTIAQNWPEGSGFEQLVTAGTMARFPQTVEAQNQAYSYAEATATNANEYTAVYNPTIVAPEPGLTVSFKIPEDNSGPSTFNGWGVDVPIRRRDGSPLIGNELITGAIAELKWNGSILLLQGLAPAPPDVAHDDTESAVNPSYLWGALANFTGAAVGAAVAYYADGSYKQTLPIVSTQSYQVRDILNVGGLTAVRFRQKAKIAPTNLAVRCDLGINGTTYGAHRADGDWSNVSAGPDPFTWVLNDCPWVDDGSIFVIGHAYQIGTIFDAAAEINRLLSYGFTAGGTTVMLLPPGGKYQKTAILRVPGCVEFDGGGSSNSWIFLADKVDQTGASPDGSNGVAHMISNGAAGASPNYPNVVSVTIRGMCLHGNRSRSGYQHGFHNIDLGGDTDTNVPLSLVKLIDVYNFGSPGYGASLGGYNSKNMIYWSGGGHWGTDGDCEDVKNRLSSNTTIYNTDMTFKYWALGGQGTNLSWNNRNGARSTGTDYYCPLVNAVFAVKSTGSSYNSTTGVVTLKTTATNTFATGDVIVVSALTGTGSDLASADGTFTVASKPGIDTITYAIATGLTINSITGGTTTGTNGTNPIRTYSGKTYASININVLTPVSPTYQKPLLNAGAGERISFIGTPGFNGCTFNGSFNILGVTDEDGQLKFDLNGQTANASGNGGGSAVSVFNAGISVGDRIIDMRGLNFRATNCAAEGWANKRNGYYQRVGSGLSNAQVGGEYCVISGCSFVDTSPAWIGTLADSTAKCRGGATLLSIGGRVVNNTFTSLNRVGGKAINIGAEATGFYVAGNTVTGFDVCYLNQGRYGTLSGNFAINPIIKGFVDNGAQQQDAVSLNVDGLEPQQLGGIQVLVSASEGLPAGFHIGANVRLSHVINTNNGIVIRTPNIGGPYSITGIVDQFSFTINADGSPGATNLDPFGGDSMDARTDGQNQSTYGNTYISPKVLFNNNITPDSRFQYAFDLGNSDGDAVGLSSFASISGLVVDPVVPVTQVVRDMGLNTIWDATGISPAPREVIADIVQAPHIINGRGIGPLITPGKVAYAVPFPMTKIIFGNLDWCSTLIISGTGLMHDSLSNQNWGIEFSADNGVTFATSNYNRIGGTSGTSKLLFSGSVAGNVSIGFEAVVLNFNQPWRTPVRLKGGTKNDPNNIMYPGYYDGNTVFNAFCILPSAGNAIAGLISVQGLPLGDI